MQGGLSSNANYGNLFWRGASCNAIFPDGLGRMVFFGETLLSLCQLPAPISHGRVAVSCLANKGICLGTFSMHRFKRECQCRFLPTCSVCLI